MRARSSLVDETVAELRQMILSGQFRAGEFLPPQRELAERFGVGASTIREAVQALVTLGLLQSHSGKGTWVREDAAAGLIHPETVKARLGELKAEGLYEARSVIEVSLTEMAAARATPEDLQAIQDALHAMREMAHDTPAFVQADLEFHIAVARAGHNDLLAQFYQLAHTLLLEATQHLVSLPNVKAQSIEIQSAILHAIEQGNPQEARRAAQKHMHYIQQLMIKP